MSRDEQRISKFISLLLRHSPETAGLALDAAGYVSVDALLEALTARGHHLDREGLRALVEDNDKQRFAFDETGARIRAVQGHSIPVDLGLDPIAPPARLFHGTVERALDAIREQGLKRGGRHHVHLSCDVETAKKVGSRRGRPVVLTIDAGTMHGDGNIFFRSQNGVWLTLAVAPVYIVDWGDG